jgi:hypothetical protein
LFTVLMCADCQAARGNGSGPYPAMTRAEMRAGLDLLPTWALEQKAAANRQVIAVMRQRLAAGEQVARMYQEPGLAWLERQAEAAEDLVVERQAATKRHADVVVASRRPLPRERKHRHLVTSGDASIAPLTLAFAVVACRLLPSRCRVFAACSPPGGFACGVLRNDPETDACHDAAR